MTHQREITCSLVRGSKGDCLEAVAEGQRAGGACACLQVAACVWRCERTKNSKADDNSDIIMGSRALPCSARCISSVIAVSRAAAGTEGNLTREFRIGCLKTKKERETYSLTAQRRFLKMAIARSSRALVSFCVR